ncbi:unnamed protein product [Trichogramma brassicae]|uniref:Uncharacterized protein n=1 Tax=Trichogramma brassicae TaxID=86971 RepID=A0A6H5IJX7_9HYME|nr:unnamed protein product [Trichogramma brassicae]
MIDVKYVCTGVRARIRLKFRCLRIVRMPPRRRRMPSRDPREFERFLRCTFGFRYRSGFIRRAPKLTLESLKKTTVGGGDVTPLMIPSPQRRYEMVRLEISCDEAADPRRASAAAVYSGSRRSSVCRLRNAKCSGRVSARVCVSCAWFCTRADSERSSGESSSTRSARIRKARLRPASRCQRVARRTALCLCYLTLFNLTTKKYSSRAHTLFEPVRSYRSMHDKLCAYMHDIMIKITIKLTIENIYSLAQSSYNGSSSTIDNNGISRKRKQQLARTECTNNSRLQGAYARAQDGTYNYKTITDQEFTLTIYFGCNISTIFVIQNSENSLERAMVGCRVSEREKRSRRAAALGQMESQTLDKERAHTKKGILLNYVLTISSYVLYPAILESMMRRAQQPGSKHGRRPLVAELYGRAAARRVEDRAQRGRPRLGQTKCIAAPAPETSSAGAVRCKDFAKVYYPRRRGGYVQACCNLLLGPTMNRFFFFAHPPVLSSRSRVSAPPPALVCVRRLRAWMDHVVPQWDAHRCPPGCRPHHPAATRPARGSGWPGAPHMCGGANREDEKHARADI